MSARTPTAGNAHEAAPELSDLDCAKLILDAVGKEVLEKILRDYIELGGGSIVLYDNNGGYVLPVAASRYCAKLWEASLHSCGTTDVAGALRSGKWRCQEKHWATAQAAIAAGEASDASCPGGLRVHAVPIRAGTGVIGAISVGYGEPLGEEAAIREVAAEYGLALDELAQLAKENPPLPAWLLAKLPKNVSTLATLIGEIVEARLAEQAARKNEERFHALVEFAPDAMVLARASGEIVTVNAQTEKLFGYSRDELLGQPVELLIPEGLRAAHVRHRAGYASDPHPRSMSSGIEFHCRRKNGSEVPVEISLLPIRSGDELLVMSAIRDVTERVRGKRALEASERKFRDIFEKALDAIAILSAPGGRYVSVNPQWERLSGFSMQEVVGRTPREINLFANKETYRRVLRELEVAGQVRSFEVEFRRKTGETFWVLFSVVQVELDGAPSILSFTRDITERKRAQQQLESYAATLEVWRKRHEALVRASGQVLYIWNVVTGELAWEGTFNRVTKYDVLPAKLDQALELVHPEDRPAVEAALRRVSQTRSPLRLAFRLRHADGSHRLVDSTGYFIEERPGAHEVVGFLVDITERRALEEAERHSTERLRDLFNGLPLGLYRSTPEHGFDDVNPAFLRMSGYPSFESLRSVGLDALCANTAMRDQFRSRLAEQGTVTAFETTLRRLDGSIFPASISARLVRGPDGGVLHYDGIVEDISRRKAMEAEIIETRDRLAASERRFRALAENSSDGLSLHAADGTVLYASPSHARITGWANEEIIGKRDFEFVHEQDALRWTDGMAEVLRQPGLPRVVALRGITKEGSLKWVEVTLTNRLADPDIAAIVSNLRDVSERKRAEAELRALSRRLMAAQEHVRRAIARELHDEAGQLLTVLKLNLANLQRSAGPSADPRLGESLEIVGQTLDLVRNLSFELRPSILDDLGLAAALRWQLRRHAKAAGFAAEIAADDSFGRVAADIETACFRTALEALTNISRHAHAKHVSVGLERDDHGISLTIRDDGAGFDVAAAVRRARRGGSLGLVDMRERVEIIGGRLSIESEPGAGTVIRARFPAVASAEPDH